ncbi:MAG: hypothetical protein KBT35_07495 [Firmicutes bacterium]|nr:hypothetical protein [Candidatus Colivicinus equi]
MAKTKEELNGLKEELISFTTKLKELDDNEIDTIVGGGKIDINFDLIPAPESKGDITRRVFGEVFRSVFTDTPTTSTFTGENVGDSKSEYALDTSDESVFK